MAEAWADFAALDPPRALDWVERAYGLQVTGLWIPHASYINRVAEFETEEGARYVGKWFRPGRWSLEALADEMDFVLDLAEDEVPVAAPLLTRKGAPLAEAGGFTFAVYPKRAGRTWDLESLDDFARVGSLLGRLHRCGAAHPAPHRPVLGPETTGRAHWAELQAAGSLPPPLLKDFDALFRRVFARLAPAFAAQPRLRCHGDFHRGNVLVRPGEGLTLIDFDDCCLAPPVQDFWMLLPGRALDSRAEWEALEEGYRSFRSLPEGSFGLIEGLRLLRMLHYLAWCARQRQDTGFAERYPGWGSPGFWEQEWEDFQKQEQEIAELAEASGSGW